MSNLDLDLYKAIAKEYAHHPLSKRRAYIEACRKIRKRVPNNVSQAVSRIFNKQEFKRLLLMEREKVAKTTTMGEDEIIGALKELFLRASGKLPIMDRSGVDQTMFIQQGVELVGEERKRALRMSQETRDEYGIHECFVYEEDRTSALAAAKLLGQNKELWKEVVKDVTAADRAKSLEAARNRVLTARKRIGEGPSAQSAPSAEDADANGPSN